MKFLLALFAALTFSAQAQTPIRVLHVFTNEAKARVLDSGKTLTQYVNDQVIFANVIYANSGVTAYIQNVGIQTGLCCGITQRFRDGRFSLEGGGMPDFTDHSIGGVTWAKTNIPLMDARDAAGADMVVVFGDYDDGSYTNDPGGVSGAVCGSSDPTRDPVAKNAVVGVNYQWAAMSPDVYAHEVGHQLCMSHYDQWFYARGNSPGTCEVWYTMEAGSRGLAIDYRTFTQTTTTQCWKPQAPPAGGPCYSTPHAAVVTQAPSSSCTYSGGYFVSPTQWNENINCSPGTYYIGAFRGPDTVTTSTFVCDNVAPVLQVANPNTTYRGLPLGDANHNTAAKMSAKALSVTNYHLTKLAPPLRAAVEAAVSNLMGN